MDLLEKCLREDEGFRDHVYLDSKGNPTGGWGHHFEIGSELPLEVCKLLLKHDIAIATDEYLKIPRRLRSRLNKARGRVIVCMIFNMKGLRSVMGFTDMWAAIEREDWTAAKVAGLDSKWHKDVGSRAERLMAIMESGVWPGENDGISV